MSLFFNLPKDKHAVVVSPSIVVFAITLILGLYFVYVIRWIVTLVFLSFIIMTALHPWVVMLNRRAHIPRPLSIAIVYIVVMLLLSLLLALILPALGNELYQFIRTIDVPALQNGAKDLRFSITELSALAERVGTSIGLIFSVVTSTFSSLFNSFTVIVLSVYLMLDRQNLHKKVIWFTSEQAHVEQAERLLDSIERQLGGWIRGQAILMLAIGFIVYFGLRLLGIQYALPLAIVAGLLEILPNLGPTIAAVPAIVFGFMSGGYILAGAVALFYIVVQQLENNFIVPKVMETNADVNPLVAIVAILTGLELGGVVGAFLSVPAYIVIRSLYAFWYHKRLA